MNYRHTFHAGNFADVFKHVLLSRLVLGLARKEAPFRVVDTHAGAGLYDLAGPEATRAQEWRGGVARVRPGGAPPALEALLAPWLEVVGPRDAEGRPGLYPGSPVVALALMRPGDRLIACETQPQVAYALSKALRDDARAKRVAIDGYVGLNAFVPPVERRGLVLIDPPFEDRGEFEAMTAAFLGAHRKWATGVYALWYPGKDARALTAFARALRASAVPRLLRLDLAVRPPDPAGPLGACGLVVANPPFGFEEEARAILPHLARVMADEGARGEARVEWITPG